MIICNKCLFYTTVDYDENIIPYCNYWDENLYTLHPKFLWANDVSECGHCNRAVKSQRELLPKLIV